MTTLTATDFGRALPTPDANSTGPYEIRQRILLDTVRALEEGSATRKFHKIAKSNLERWRLLVQAQTNLQPDERDGCCTCNVTVKRGDWGAVTSQLTKEYGTTFAVLNMASSHVPGGGYTEGCPAQEENMFRRTDCHFSIKRDDQEIVKLSNDPFDADLLYTSTMTQLLNGSAGKVYLDIQNPRICIRGPEDISRDDLGYDFLKDDGIFPFYELRAAAVDLRGGKRFDADEMRHRIAAQFETLANAGIRHAVLSAFGCGAFLNPSADVASIYREEMEQRHGDFDVVAFAIFHAGYGPDNFRPFQKAFESFGKPSNKSYADMASTPEKKRPRHEKFTTP